MDGTLAFSQLYFDVMGLVGSGVCSCWEALKQDMWQQAMEAKIQSIEWNGSWDLVPRLAKQKVIGVNWVFKTKYNN